MQLDSASTLELLTALVMLLALGFVLSRELFHSPKRRPAPAGMGLRLRLRMVSIVAPENSSRLQNQQDTIRLCHTIYSLGVVLHQMATGHPTFRAETSEELIGAILHQTPIKPSELNPPVPASLERIILKALEKEPTARYQSVADLLADLEKITASRSLAVLPFANLSGDPAQEYFADGMTEALLTELGKISALRVISRQSMMRYEGGLLFYFGEDHRCSGGLKPSAVRSSPVSLFSPAWSSRFLARSKEEAHVG